MMNKAFFLLPTACILLFVSLFFSCENPKPIVLNEGSSFRKDIMPKNIGQLGIDWIQYSGKWQLNNGRLSPIEGTDKLDFRILYKWEQYNDFTLELKARVVDERALEVGGDLSVIVGANKSMSHYYDLQIGGVGNQYACIQMIDKPLAVKKFSLEAGRTYEIRIEKRNDAMYLYCDNELLLDAKNSWHLSGNYIGLYTYGAGKEFWDIKLLKYPTPNSILDIANIDSMLTKAQENKQDVDLLKLCTFGYHKILNHHTNDSYLEKKVYSRLAKVALQLKNVNDAEFYLKTLEDEETWLELELLHFHLIMIKGKYEEAISKAEELIKKYPNRGVFIASYIQELLSSNDYNTIEEKYKTKMWSIVSDNTSNTWIYARNAKLKNLSFLTRGFKTTNFVHNEITDLTHINNLDISYLNVIDNNISDIKQLKNDKIISIYLIRNKLQSIEGIYLDKLKTLTLSVNPIKDISPLKNAPVLSRLELDECGLTDISTLSTLSKLLWITFGKNDIKELPDFQSKLRDLQFSQNKISDISKLKDQTNLEQFICDNNNISDISAVANMKLLKKLIIFNNPIKSIKPLFDINPNQLFFYSDTLDIKELEEISAHWKKQEKHVLSHDALVMAELRKGEKGNLKKLARKYQGHYYLAVPMNLDWYQAKEFCEKQGGHLATFSHRIENIGDHIYVQEASYWIGLTEENKKLKWVTNEPVILDNTLYQETFNTSDRFYYYNGKKSWSAGQSKLELPFIMEWDN